MHIQRETATRRWSEFLVKVHKILRRKIGFYSRNKRSGKKNVGLNVDGTDNMT